MRAGTAEAVITPELPVRLAGYGDRRGDATTVHRDLELRAVMLADDDTTLCLLVFDLLAMSADRSAPIRAAVADALDIPVGAVLTACTHVHAGPSTLTGSDALGWTVDPAYCESLVETARVAALEARDGAREAELFFGRGPLPAGVAVNRRGHALAPTTVVLDIRTSGGERLGTIANFGIHPVVTGPSNLAVDTDWVGPFRGAVEAAIGGRAVFLQGCQGDVNPATMVWEGGADAWFDAAAAVGRTLAEGVTRLVDAAVPVDGPLAVTEHRRIHVPVERTALTTLVDLDRDLEVELVEWRIGSVTLVSVPGEAFTAVQQRLEAARGEQLLLANLSPHWHGYLPEPFGDGYEEGLSYGEPAVREIVAAIESGSRS